MKIGEKIKNCYGRKIEEIKIQMDFFEKKLKVKKISCIPCDKGQLIL